MSNRTTRYLRLLKEVDDDKKFNNILRNSHLYEYYVWKTNPKFTSASISL